MLDDGRHGLDVAGEISKYGNAVSLEKAGIFVGLSISNYCPEHGNAFG